MTAAELVREIDVDPDFEGMGITEVGAIVVRHIPTGLITQVDSSKLADHSWLDIRAVLSGQRSPQALYHMTRVCGYYSRIENWNASKVAELQDRRKGNYAI